MQLIGDGFGNLALDRKDIGQIAIISLRPKVGISLRVDQLRIYPHPIGDALHAAFQQMSYAELLTDLAQIPHHSAPVLHHAGAADHLQVRDLGQISQDFILHTIGKVFVLFFLTQVFEGQHGDRFVCDRRRRWRCRSYANELEDKQTGGDDREHGGDGDKLAPSMMGDRFVSLHLRFAHNSFGRDLERPGKRQRNREPNNKDEDDDLHHPWRRIECGKENRCRLNREPRDNCVSDSDFVNVAALQLGEEVHRQMNASGPFSGVGEHRSGQRFFFQ